MADQLATLRNGCSDLAHPPALRALLAAGLAAFVVAGCGIGSNPEKTVVSAATTTLSQALVSTLTLRDAAVVGAPGAQIAAKGASVFASGLGYAAINLAPVVAVKPAVEYLVLLPRTVYVMPISAEAAGLPSGKTWLSVPLPGAGPAARAFPRLAEQIESLNAELLLDEIVWGATGARHVGEPVIDHVPLSEYVVTVDLRLAASRAAGASASVLRAAIAEELAAVRTRRPGAMSAQIRVWVDGPGHVARLEASLPGSGVGTVTIALSGFGAGIGRSLPLASDVAGLAALIRAGAKLPASPLAIGVR